MATRKKVTKRVTPISAGPRTLSARDLRISQKLTPIHVPEYGGIVYKRELPASVMISRPAVADPNDPIQQQNTVSYFICKSIVDENGNQIFADEEADTLRDILSISVYTLFTQAVTGSGGAAGTAGLSLTDKDGGALPNDSTATRSSDSDTD